VFLRTWIQIVLIRFVVDKDLRLYQKRQYLCKDILVDGGGGDQFVQRQRIVVVVLQEYGHLVRARHQDVLLIEVICAKLVLGIIPKPRQFATRVFLLVVFLESIVRWQDFCRDNKVVVGSAQWPEIGSKDHDTEVDVHIVVVRLHAFLELIGKILAQAHICKEKKKSVLCEFSVRM
jgi:hypothetical protein